MKSQLRRIGKGWKKFLDKSSPALLLIAEHFSGKNGIEIAERELERFPTLPILLFAEMDTTGTIKAVLKAGLSGYLYPPLRTDDIVDAVNRSLARARHLGDWIRREVKRTTSSLEKRTQISEIRTRQTGSHYRQHRRRCDRPRSGG